MRVLLPFATAVATVTGTIHSARASFTVVPMARAGSPYFAQAPTTELVSWIASAAHNPNWVCDNFSAVPIAGKVSSATEFSMKIVPSETDISSSVAPTTGPIAAIALPPQIAVPAEIRKAARGRSDTNLPIAAPTIRAKAIPTAVYRNPLQPARSTCCRFKAKPRPTTADCKRYFEICRDSPGYGWLAMAPKNSPASRASDGVAHRVAQNTRPRTKRIFDLMRRTLGGARHFLFYRGDQEALGQ